MKGAATKSPFAAVTSVQRVGPNRHVATVTDGWQHGTGAFGGVGLGIASRALLEAGESEHAALLTASFVGPLEIGAVDIDTEALKAHGNTRMFAARLTQNGVTRLVAEAQIVARPSPVPPMSPPPPSVPPWRDTPVLGAVEHMPAFSRHFEYRLVGPVPFCEGPEAVVVGWVRPLEPVGAWGIAEIAAVSDAYWPSYFSILGGPRLAMSVHYSLALTVASRDLDPAEPLLSRARTILADAGQLLEIRELWSPAGQLAAVSTQTLRVVR